MHNILIDYFLAGTLGVLFQIFVIKIPKLRETSLKANHPFLFSEYLKNDWPAIVGSFITVAIFILSIDEVISIRPELAKVIKWLFVFVGFTGSSIAQALFSVTNKKIMAIIDIKTNIADKVVPPVNEENKEGVAEIIKDRQNERTN